MQDWPLSDFCPGYPPGSTHSSSRPLQRLSSMVTPSSHSPGDAQRNRHTASPSRNREALWPAPSISCTPRPFFHARDPFPHFPTNLPQQPGPHQPLPHTVSVETLPKYTSLHTHTPFQYTYLLYVPHTNPTHIQHINPPNTPSLHIIVQESSSTTSYTQSPTSPTTFPEHNPSNTPPEHEPPLGTLLTTSSTHLYV